MSLSISVHRVDQESGDLAEEIPLSPGGDLAGFESWRSTVYGADEAVRLGLVILPSLRENPEIHIRGDDLKKLKAEADLIATEAMIFAGRAACDEGTIRSRAKNISRACDVALSASALVWIS
jgi:hypothetical protein